MKHKSEDMSKDIFDKYLIRLINGASKKYGVSKEEVKETIDEFSNTILKVGYEDRLISKLRLLKSKVMNTFSRFNFTNQEIEVIFVAKDRITDFGNSKKIEEAKKFIKTDLHNAIEKGLCDKDGNVLHKEGIMKDKPFDEDDLFQRNIYGITKIDNEVVLIKFVAKKQALGIDFPLFRKIKINCSIGKQNPDKPKRFIACYTTPETTSFEYVDDKYYSINKYKDLFKKEFKFDVDTFQKESKKQNGDKTDYDAFWIKKFTINFNGIPTKNGGYMVSLSPLKNGVDIDEFDNFDEEGSYTGFVDFDLGITNTSDGYVIGKSYSRQDGTIGVNILGVSVEPQFRKLELDDETKKDMSNVVKEMEKTTSKKEVETPKKEEVTPKKEVKDSDVEDW